MQSAPQDAELREMAVTALDFLEALLTDYSPRDAAKKDLVGGIRPLLVEWRQRLAAPVVDADAMATQKGGSGTYSFDVERRQYTSFDVQATSTIDAFHKAAVQLHQNVEALRFRWDRDNPKDLSVLHLTRWPPLPKG